MNNYKIVLKSAGAVTQLPDSQKIFGALVTGLSRMKGEEVASKLVEAVFARTIHLTLSNLLPLGFLPVPQDYIVEKIAETISEDEDLKEKRAQVKKRTYIKEEQLNILLKDPMSCCSIYPYIKEYSGQQLRASMERDGLGVEGLEKKLYTVPVTVLRKVNEENDMESKTDPVFEFQFYLQGNEDQAVNDLLVLLEKMKQEKEPLILGKRASQGLNKYYISKVICLGQEELANSNSGSYLNLGMLLPDQIDFENSYLKLFTSERRPFSMPGGWNQTFPKWFISFIDCGSVITLQDRMEQAGKCVWSPLGEGRNLVFGNAFLYPAEL